MTERHVNPEDLDLSALGALDGEEKEALEEHVRSCPACAQALEAARRQVALLAFAAPSASPAPGVRDALLRRARMERPMRVAPAPRPRRFAWLTPALAVAAMVFAVLDGWLWSRNAAASRQISDLESQIALAQTQNREIAHASAAADELLGAPGTMHVSLAQQPDAPQGRAGVLYNPRMGMVMCVGQLPPPPAGKSYQLWLVPMQGKPMSLGVYSGSKSSMEMMSHVAPGTEAKAFAITVEPLGGMPQPTGPKVLVGVAG
ncbi:MAG TPA: anti-sigma factor [Acidobacteriaceae bacterium]|nr:anti-sigma factor [Acidobacteriaceae bacterium]